VLKIYIDLNSLKKYSSKNSHIATFFLNKNFIYSNENWNDFVVIILNWWLDAFKRLESNLSSEEFLFMDGSYRFETLKENNIYIAIFYDELDNQIFKIYNFDYKSFCEEIKKAAQSLIEYIYQSNLINNRDLVELVHSISIKMEQSGLGD